MGIFKITAYCPCVECSGKYGKQTASGVTAVEGVTVAADTNVLPFGTTLEIDGVGRRIVQDRGSAVKGKHLDLYFDGHGDTVKFGVRELRVWKV